MPPKAKAPSKVALARAASQAAKAAREAAAAPPASATASTADSGSTSSASTPATEGGAVASTSSASPDVASPSAALDPDAALAAAEEEAEHLFPPAKALPTEPMDLDETQETGEGDTEMLEVEGVGGKGILPVEPEAPPSKHADEVNGRKRDKGKERERPEPARGTAGEMKSMQDVGGDPRHLADGLEALGQENYKGKALTDPIKSVTVRLSYSLDPAKKSHADRLWHSRTSGICCPPSSP